MEAGRVTSHGSGGVALTEDLGQVRAEFAVGRRHGEGFLQVANLLIEFVLLKQLETVLLVCPTEVQLVGRVGPLGLVGTFKMLGGLDVNRVAQVPDAPPVGLSDRGTAGTMRS